MKFKRGLLLTVGAIGAAYLINLVRKDLARYDRIARMSGDKPLIAEQLGKLKDLATGGSRNGGN